MRLMNMHPINNNSPKSSFIVQTQRLINPLYQCIRYRSIAVLALLVSSAAILPSSGCNKGDTTFITIGTGGFTGVYYPVGGYIASLINEGRAEHGIDASVESTDGSVFNINAVLANSMEFGIAQADRQYQAYTGQHEWESTGPRENLRSVCGLYTEMVTLAAAVDAGIETLTDLRGKTVNIGNPGSGERGNAIQVLSAVGIDIQSDINAQGIKSSESAKLLQDGRIDAYFFTVGHPAGSLMEAMSGRRQIRLIPITGMENLIEQEPYYTEGIIPIQYYPNVVNEQDVKTIGVKTTIVTSVDVPETIVYEVTRVIVENLETLKHRHEALNEMTLESLVKGLTAPLHPGAERYFNEIGLL